MTEAGAWKSRGRAAYTTGYTYDERCLKHQGKTSHPEAPKRIQCIFDKITERGLARQMKRIPARPATRQELLLTHAPEHVAKIEQLGADGYEPGEIKFIDQDTFHSDGSALAATLAAGSVTELLDQVVRGTLDNAFAIVRPPGHHCENCKAQGFCLFNNVCVAINAVKKKYGLRRVMIVDWDVHHGNGSQQIFWDDPDVLTLSVHRSDRGVFYPRTGFISQVGGKGAEGKVVNIPLNCANFGDREYIEVFEKLVIPIAKDYRPEVIVIASGFDASIKDPVGGFRLSPQAYSIMTKMLMDVQPKIVTALEGGYNLRTIAECGAEVMETLLTGKASELMCPEELFGFISQKGYDEFEAVYQTCLDDIENCMYKFKRYFRSLDISKAAKPIMDARRQRVFQRSAQVKMNFKDIPEVIRIKNTGHKKLDGIYRYTENKNDHPYYEKKVNGYYGMTWEPRQSQWKVEAINFSMKAPEAFIGGDSPHPAIARGYWKTWFTSKNVDSAPLSSDMEVEICPDDTPDDVVKNVMAKTQSGPMSKLDAKLAAFDGFMTRNERAMDFDGVIWNMCVASKSVANAMEKCYRDFNNPMELNDAINLCPEIFKNVREARRKLNGLDPPYPGKAKVERKDLSTRDPRAASAMPCGGSIPAWAKPKGPNDAKRAGANVSSDSDVFAGKTPAQIELLKMMKRDEEGLKKRTEEKKKRAEQGIAEPVWKPDYVWDPEADKKKDEGNLTKASDGIELGDMVKQAGDDTLGEVLKIYPDRKNIQVRWTSQAKDSKGSRVNQKWLAKVGEHPDKEDTLYQFRIDNPDQCGEGDGGGGQNQKKEPPKQMSSWATSVPDDPPQNSMANPPAAPPAAPYQQPVTARAQPSASNSTSRPQGGAASPARYLNANQNVKTGDRVERGRDWNKFWRHDGGAGNMGTIQTVNQNVKGNQVMGVVVVKWDEGGTSQYFMGKKNKYGVQLSVSGGKPPQTQTRPKSGKTARERANEYFSADDKPPQTQTRPTRPTPPKPKPTQTQQAQMSARISVTKPSRTAMPGTTRDDEADDAFDASRPLPKIDNNKKKPPRPGLKRLKSRKEVQGALSNTRAELNRMRSCDHRKVDAREGFRLFRQMMDLKQKLTDPNLTESAAEGDEEGPSFNITIRVMTGTEFPFSVRLDETVPQVKKRLEATLNVPVAQQILVCNGKTVSGSGSLRNYSLEEGSIVFLINDEPQ